MPNAQNPNAQPPPATDQDAPTPVGPPTRHQLALMIWIAVVPTVIVLNLVIGPWLSDASMVLRTLVLATLAVPIVIDGAMPRLHAVRARLLTARS